MPELQYIALYPDAVLALARSGDLEAVGVLFALCRHADGFGGCDPGDERLGALSGHRRDAIPAILERLQAADYIHIMEIAVPFRQKPLRGFQINPYVLRLKPENHASACASWQAYELQTKGHNGKQTSPITYGENDQQADQIQNQIKNQLQKQRQKPAPNLETQALRADQPRPESEGQKPEQDEEETHADLDTHREAGRTASASAPFRREPLDLARYRRALDDDASENLALDMVNLAGDLSRENARMLVDTYGWEQTARVLQLYHRAKSVSAPARWIRSMLRKLDREEQRG